MRKRQLYSGFIFVAILAGSISHAQAKNDFEALLADVDFGGSAAIAPEASSGASSLAATSATNAMSLPPAAAETLTASQAAVAVPADQVAVAGYGDQCDGQCGAACGGSCGSSCCGRIGGKCCQPYSPPQLPTSTFYQYWRSNACNVHAWDGFQNRCRPTIDLSIHRKQSCGAGGCNNIQPAGVVDCGPAPVEWSGQQACDSCDGR